MAVKGATAGATVQTPPAPSTVPAPQERPGPLQPSIIAEATSGKYQRVLMAMRGLSDEPHTPGAKNPVAYYQDLLEN